MERWNSEKRAHLENAKVDAFLADIWTVCEKHGLAISHEDEHGAFIVEEKSDDLKQWLLSAQDSTEITTPTTGD